MPAQDLPPLHPDARLVVHRVAQEGRTDVVRHARARRASFATAPRDDEVELGADDDDGLPQESAGGSGLQGRALLVGAPATAGVAPGGRGTGVRLRIPEEERPAITPPRRGG